MQEWGEFAQLLIAYLLVRYAIQPKKWTENKIQRVWKSAWLYVESLLLALLVFYFAGKWTLNDLWIPLVVFFVHILLEGGRITLEKKYPQKSWMSLLEFLLHAIILLLIWNYEVEKIHEIIRSGIDFISHPHVWLIALSYFIVWFPANEIIRIMIQRLQENVPKEDAEEAGLPNAGIWIGVLERTLVLTFIINNSIQAIGLLIAAKSVLRFGEISDPNNRKEAEYILIGTLLSFSIAIILGLWIRAVLLGAHVPIPVPN